MPRDDVPLVSLPDWLTQAQDVPLASFMTHWPQVPNPAVPYIQGAKRIAGDISEFIPGIGGGLQGLANREQINTPQWSQAIGHALHNEAADTAMGLGTVLGKGPPQMVRAFKGAHPYVNEPDRDWMGNIIKSYGEPQERDLSKGASSAGHAGFFSSDPEVANRFAIAESRQPAVFPVNVAFKKPMIIDGEGKPAAAWQFDSVAREHGMKDELEAVRNALHPNSEFDGVIVRNTKDEGDVYIPKTGSQITSQFSAPAGIGPASEPTLSERISNLEQSLGRKLRPDLSLEQVEKLEQAGSAGNKSSRYKSLATIQARKAIGEDIYPGAPKQVEEPPPSITAFHGSPHDFDKFDLSKIGTGEGAQAYGHGLYFAENEGVARDYQRNVSANNPAQLRVVDEAIDRMGIDNPQLKEQLRINTKKYMPTVMDEWSRRGDYSLDSAKKLLAERGFTGGLADNLAAVMAEKPPRMYQVSIKTDPEHFLDWDKPLNEQSEKVRQALKQLGQSEGNKYLQRTGETALKSLRTDLGGDEKATDALRAAGIPGIKYLDQGSRFTEHQSLRQEIEGYERELQSLNSPDWPRPPGGVPPGHAERVSEALAEAKASLAKLGPESSTRNFVVFDDKLIDILKKYGLAGLAALPALNAMQSRPVPLTSLPPQQ